MAEVPTKTKEDYETVLIDTIGNLCEALKRKKYFADDFSESVRNAEETIRNLQTDIRSLTIDRDQWKKDHGDNLSAYNERGRDIAELRRDYGKGQVKNAELAGEVIQLKLKLRRRSKR